jgi:hypothetical protein
VNFNRFVLEVAQYAPVAVVADEPILPAAVPGSLAASGINEADGPVLPVPCHIGGGQTQPRYSKQYFRWESQRQAFLERP